MSSSADEPKFPQHVVEEIWKRLPVKSLARFRCVCRSWRSVINHQHFLALHRSARDDVSNWYFACVDWGSRLCSLFSNDSPPPTSPSQIEIPFVFTPKPGLFLASCNGLIFAAETGCISSGQTMYLWNLFTGKHKAVGRSGPEFLLGEFPRVDLGFCFDDRSNDYKIVRIIYSCYPWFGRPDKRKDRIEMYSLKTDSWRSLQCDVPPYCDFRQAIFLNGKLHWLALEMVNGRVDKMRALIVSFDVADERLDEMALPDELMDKYISDGTLSTEILNDLLAVLSITYGYGGLGVHSICSVWVMREWGVPQSWTKLYTFEVSGLVLRLGGLPWNGELLLKMFDGARVSWNPITGQLANMPSWSWEMTDMVTVVESLDALLV